MLMLLIMPGVIKAQASTRLLDKSNRHVLYTATFSSTVFSSVLSWLASLSVGGYSRWGAPQVVLSSNAAKSVFSTALLTEGLKYTFGRSRPFAEKYSRWFYVLPVSSGAARVYRDKHWQVSFNRIVVRF